MLLSYPDRYLFVHLAKTGGTSVRAALSRRRWRDPLFWNSYVCHRISSISKHRIGCKIPRHAPVVTAKEMLPPLLFNELFKFAFVRNPWDRMVSAFYHFQRERQDVLQQHRIVDVEQFIDWLLDVPLEDSVRPALVVALRRPQLEFLVDLQGEIIVDFVGRYEHLLEDFEQIRQRLSLKSIDLPHKRCSQRRRDYRTCYSDRLAARVGEHFASDVKAFEYEFDDPSAVLSRVDRGHGPQWRQPKLMQSARKKGHWHVKS